LVDPVRRQLKLLDARLAERNLGVAGLLAYCPLILPAVAFVGGIITEHMLAVPIGFAAGALPAIMLAALWRSQDQRVRLYAATAAACLAAFCLGTVRLKAYYQPRGDDIRHLVRTSRTLATVRGHLRTKPSCENQDLWKFGRYNWSPPACRFYMEARSVRSAGGWVGVSGIVFVQAPAEVANLEPGDYVELQCWLNEFGRAANPGQFDIRKSLQRRNIHVVASVESADGLRLIAAAPKGSFAAAVEGLRSSTHGALLDEILAEHDAAPVLTALLLGQRSGIDIETADAFQRTNLAHFISLSGMHLGILAMTAWRLLRMSGLPKRWRAVVCIVVIALYLVVVPVRAPTLRAAVICWVFFLSVVFARRPNPLNTLAIAAMAGLLLRPADVFTAGWQLSYATVTGIILFHRPLCNWILDRTADPLHTRLKNSGATWVTFLLTNAVDLFAVGLAAWLGGSGILLYHFGSIGPLASIWTVFVLPVVWLILVLGFAKIILTLLLPTVALVLGLLLSLLAQAFVGSVKFLAGVGLSEVRIGRVGGLYVAGYYAVMLLLRFSRIERPLYRRALFVSAVVAILMPLCAMKHCRTHRSDLEMTSLAVGHGQAVLVEFPGGQNALFDAGSLSSKNCGWRTVVPFLRHKGIGRIHHLVISHADIDHVNGIPEIVATVSVDNIWTSAAVLEKAATVSTAGYLNSCLMQLGHKMKLLDENVQLNERASVSLLWPTDEVCRDAEISDNDKSLVLLIEFAGRRILLCSDIELYAQQQILSRYPDVRADVIVMPHHGSTTNLVEGFVERLAADTVIINCSGARYAAAYRPPAAVRALYAPVDGAAAINIKADGTVSAVGFLSDKQEGLD